MTARSGSDARRIAILLVPHAVILLLSVLVTPLFGSRILTPGEFLDAILHPDAGVVTQIVLRSRLPRLVLAVAAGSGLAVSGVTLQGVFKNPLASPYTLGVASGSSLGAAIAIVLGLDFAFLGVGGVQIAAIAGGVLTMVLVLVLARGLGFTSMSLILAGVTLNLVASAAIMLVQTLSDISQSHIIIHWLMGGLDQWGSGGLAFVSTAVAAGIAACVFHSGDLNHLMVDEDLAAGRGVPVRRVMLVVLLASSAMTGAIVSAAGPVAFIGLMVPHAARLMGTHDNRYLVPASAMLGASVLMICDAFARTAFAPSEIPVGVVTSVLGGAAFLALLFARRR